MHILIVEDHDDTRITLERYFTRNGYEVAATDNLHDALDCLGKTQFDIIVSDIALPDGTGYALISEARRRGIEALGIAFSAYNYPPDVYEPKVTGFDYHLRKPMDSRRLFSIVREAGDAHAPPVRPA